MTIAIHDTVTLNGAQIHYEREGEGEALLLLHGFTGSSGDWVHAGRERLARAGHTLILPDARGHGRSTNPLPTVTHRQNAQDVLALMDHLGVRRCKAIGNSLGAKTLLHLATMAPDRVDAMVLVSAAPYFPEQARQLMRQTPVDEQPEDAWRMMRARHHHGDEQIRALWRQQRAFADSYDDVNFTPPWLSRVQARTLIVHGDNDPLYPVELALQLRQAILRSTLWVIPGGGHSPIFLEAADEFVRHAQAFLRDR